MKVKNLAIRVQGWQIYTSLIAIISDEPVQFSKFRTGISAILNLSTEV